MQTGNIEYNRIIRFKKDVRGFYNAPTFYITDLSNTEMLFTLQDVTTKVVDSVSPLNGVRNHVIVEFTLPKPVGEIPNNSNWCIEWSDEVGDLDWCELYATDKSDDTPLEVNIPY